MSRALGSNGLMIRKIQSIGRLAPEERRALLDLPVKPRTLARERAIVREGDRPEQCFSVLEGLVGRAKVSGTGKRQLVAINVPGDIPDLEGYTLRIMDHAIIALTPVTLLFFNHSAVDELVRRFPNLGRLLWRETVLDAAITRVWLFNLGRQPAVTHLAHFLCEMATKLAVVGLVDGQSFPFPLTQEQVSDALGLSNVHVNRSLQTLRREGLLEWKAGTITIRDWRGLATLGEFDPAYLHIVGEVDSFPMASEDPP
jgi:CRP-like cAMP-binding protein